MVITIGLVIASYLSRGELNIGIIQVIFAPYTLDWHKLGDGNNITSTLVVIQMLIFTSIFLRSRAKNNRIKLFISILGIILVICYFLVTFFFGLLTAIH